MSDELEDMMKELNSLANRVRAKAYREANKEKIADRARAKYEDNREEIKRKSLDYYHSKKANSMDDEQKRVTSLLNKITKRASRKVSAKSKWSDWQKFLQRSAQRSTYRVSVMSEEELKALALAALNYAQVRQGLCRNRRPDWVRKIGDRHLKVHSALIDEAHAVLDGKRLGEVKGE